MDRPVKVVVKTHPDTGYMAYFLNGVAMFGRKDGDDPVETIRRLGHFLGFEVESGILTQEELEEHFI